MKTIIAAVIALSAAVPAMAMSSDQLALSLGIEPGQYTLEQLVILKAASSEDRSNPVVNLDNVVTNVGRLISNPNADTSSN